MSLLLPSGSSTHEPLPSLPNTPTHLEEEDLGRAGWLTTHEDEEEHHTDSLIAKKKKSTKKVDKGKGKAREVVVHSVEEEDDDEVGADDGGSGSGANGSLEYPPTTSEDEDAKRVAENLKRMETAERLRRKVARESTSSVGSSSIIGDVSRRASLLWRQGGGGGRRNSRAPGNGMGSGNHKPLSVRSSEDTMPLDAMDRSPRTASSDTAFSPVRRSISPMDNPFEPPPLGTSRASLATPPVDSDTTTTINSASSATRNGAVMTPSSPPVRDGSPFADTASVATSKPPTLQAAASFTRSPPPIPLPLGLPPPKTPPPLLSSPMKTDEPLHEDQYLSNSTVQHRWWTDWLCGCHEGDDRGGDDQAGRTNPFE